MSAHLLVLALALGLDRLLGDPPWLWRRMPHPVVLFGRAIDALDRRWNREDASEAARRRAGLLAILLLLAAALLLGLALHLALRPLGWPGLVLEALVASVFLAQRSLADHVEAVRSGLATSVEEGRRAVSMIVGRDPEALDEVGVSRAAIESLAENASDGVVAPALAFLLLGLPGLLAYKMLNTADSMIGHLSARHRDFGRASAKGDDAANFVAARATVGLFALAALWRLGGEAARAALAAARADGPRHRSPNAGWPEAAMAGALGLSLGGPRRYGDLVVEAPALNASGRRAAGPDDIRLALALFRRACDLLLFLVLASLAISLF